MLPDWFLICSNSKSRNFFFDTSNFLRRHWFQSLLRIPLVEIVSSVQLDGNSKEEDVNKAIKKNFQIIALSMVSDRRIGRCCERIENRSAPSLGAGHCECVRARTTNEVSGLREEE